GCARTRDDHKESSFREPKTRKALTLSCFENQQYWASEVLFCGGYRGHQCLVPAKFIDLDIFEPCLAHELDVFVNRIVNSAKPVLDTISLEVGFDTCRRHPRMIDRKYESPAFFQDAKKLLENESK